MSHCLLNLVMACNFSVTSDKVAGLSINPFSSQVQGDRISYQTYEHGATQALELAAQRDTIKISLGFIPLKKSGPAQNTAL